MLGWFLPKCNQQRVKKAVLDMIAMLEEMGDSKHIAGGYRFRYIFSEYAGLHNRGSSQVVMTLSHRRRLGWKRILRYNRNEQTFRIRMNDLWQLADAYRELTEYYENWKDTEAARQELNDQLTAETFEDFGPPRERMG